MAGVYFSGIGTLGEKTLHSALKNYFEPDEEFHEVKYKGFVADILRGDEIIEIQTGSFSHLKKKLAVMLDDMNVTVVYPAARVKWVSWIDPETGEVTSRRRSPKLGTPYQLFSELIWIKDYLMNPRLSFRVVMLDVDEFRKLDGWSRDKKRGSNRCERIPREIGEIFEINSPDDYLSFIPDALPEIFTTADFYRLCPAKGETARRAFNILRFVGAIDHVGKKGRAFLFSRHTEGEAKLESSSESGEAVT